MRTPAYYRDQADYMRKLAEHARSAKVRESCLKVAEKHDFLAKVAAEEQASADQGQAA